MVCVVCVRQGEVENGLGIAHANPSAQVAVIAPRPAMVGNLVGPEPVVLFCALCALARVPGTFPDADVVRGLRLPFHVLTVGVRAEHDLDEKPTMARSDDPAQSQVRSVPLLPLTCEAQGPRVFASSWPSTLLGQRRAVARYRGHVGSSSHSTGRSPNRCSG